jgi:hypothetical protein
MGIAALTVALAVGLTLLLAFGAIFEGMYQNSGSVNQFFPHIASIWPRLLGTAMAAWVLCVITATMTLQKGKFKVILYLAMFLLAMALTVLAVAAVLMRMMQVAVATQ